MSARVRSLATLLALGVVLAVAAFWGWSAISEPFPKRSEPPVCVDREVAKGDKIRQRDVTVSVLNGGTRIGLAGLTMDLLSEAGFREGSEGNTRGKRRVARVEIWTDDPRSPAVRLVASHFGDPSIVRRTDDQPGVLVVVGDGFDDLVPGRQVVTATRAATVCSPPRRAR